MISREIWGVLREQRGSCGMDVEMGEAWARLGAGKSRNWANVESRKEDREDSQSFICPCLWSLKE